MRPGVLLDFIVNKLQNLRFSRENVRISPGFLLGAAGLWMVDPGLVLPVGFSVLVHELGHFFALKLFKNRIKFLKLTLFGWEMEPQKMLGYRQEAAVAAAGPLASLGFGIFMAHFHHFLLAGTSFSLGFCNLFPVFPLDGGRIFRGLLGWGAGVEKGLVFAEIVSKITAFLLIFGSFYLFLRYGGLTPLLLGGWLFWQAFRGQDG